MDNNRSDRKTENAVERFEVDLAEGLSRPATPERKKRTSDRASWYWVGRMGEIGFTIALPPAGGAIFGSYLDREWGSYPRMTLMLLGIGVFVSGYGFVQIVLEVIRRKRT